MAFDTSPSTILGYRQAVVDAIKAKLPTGVQVEKHDGYFDEATVERFSMAAPAVYVAMLNAKPYSGRGSGINTNYGTGEQIFQLETVCFIIATHMGATDASDIAWSIGEIIASLAVQNAFTDATMPAEGVSIENLWSNKSDKRGISMASVHWRNDLALGTDFTALAQMLEGAMPGDTFGGSPTATVVETIDGSTSGSPPTDTFP